MWLLDTGLVVVTTIVLFVYYEITTSEERTEFKGVSFNRKVCCCKTLELSVQQYLIIRLKITVYLPVLKYRIL